LFSGFFGVFRFFRFCMVSFCFCCVGFHDDDFSRFFYSDLKFSYYKFVQFRNLFNFEICSISKCVQIRNLFNFTICSNTPSVPFYNAYYFLAFVSEYKSKDMFFLQRTPSTDQVKSRKSENRSGHVFMRSVFSFLFCL
jgi:hypothetical protein